MKNFPRKKKFKNQKNKQETFSLVPLSLPSLNCKADFLFLPKKVNNATIWQKNNFDEIFFFVKIMLFAHDAAVWQYFFGGNLVLCFAE